MSLKKRVEKLEDEIRHIGKVEAALEELSRNISSLMEYMNIATLQRQIVARPKNEPTSREASPSTANKRDKQSKIMAIRATLKGIGCEFDDTKKTVKVLKDNKKVAVILPSGKLERKVTINGVTGWKTTTLKKLMARIKKGKV